MLSNRYDAVRLAAFNHAAKQGTPEMEDLAVRIKQFQFRDIRSKAASEIGDLKAASELLDHTEEEITQKVCVYRGGAAG
ncbi:hypothetical protein CSQ89_19110 [Chitinimonas sp. BJB300]|nr:hypothetical protein CSQ89_19110 [Chitinimonas sp. BJB300]TSJ90204.1 hypothetical protein FG002_007900 [Chitinimonas sp. BJB300]